MPEFLLDDINLEISLEGFESDQIVGVNIVSSVNNIMSATVSVIPLGNNGSIGGNTHLFSSEMTGALRPSRFIGKDIEITWKSTYGDVLLFKGYVTGASWSKSSASIRYDLNCQSGMPALHQTSIGANGLINFCMDCDEFESDALSVTLDRGNFTSVKTFLITALDSLIIAHSAEKDRMPQDIKKLSDTIIAALDQCLDEANSIKEPSILTRFWGIAGLFDEYPEELALTLAERLQQNLGATWMQYLMQIMQMVDIKWVSTKWGVLFLPNMAFTPSPSFNVVFPPMIENYSISHEIFNAPGALLMGYDDHPTSDHEFLQESVWEGKFISYPESIDIDDIIVPRIFANTYRIITPPAFSENFFKTAFSKETAKEWEGKNLFQIAEEGTIDKTAFHQAGEKFNTWIKNWLSWHYYSSRYATNAGHVSLTLCPNIIPGFTATIFDEAIGSFAMGYVQSVNHTITEGNTSTNITMSHMVSDPEISKTIFQKLDNPIFVDLKDSVPQVAQEVTGLSVQTVSPTDSVDRYSKEFKDPLAASSFMQRWS